MRHALVLSAIALSTLTACDDEKSGTADGLSCEESRAEVALDEVTALGFSAAEVAAYAEGEHVETLAWTRDGSTTGLTITVTLSGETANYVDSEPADTEGDTGAMPVEYDMCADYLEIPVTVSVITEDGAFNESWSTTLQAAAAASASLYHEFDPLAMTGTYDITLDNTEPDYDELRAFFDASFSAEGTQGAISGQVSGSEDCEDGDDCSAWAGFLDIASWPSSASE